MKNNTVDKDSTPLSVKETNRRILDQEEQWAMEFIREKARKSFADKQKPKSPK